MAAVVVGKGGGGKPPSAIYIKGKFPLKQSGMTVHGQVCLHGKHILHRIATICNSNDYDILQ